MKHGRLGVERLTLPRHARRVSPRLEGEAEDVAGEIDNGRGSELMRSSHRDLRRMRRTRAEFARAASDSHRVATFL